MKEFIFKDRYRSIIDTDDIENLVNLYSEKHRYYHNLDHIESMFKYVDTLDSYIKDTNDIMCVAIWFHDAIYDPTKNDNEDKSIELFEQSNTYQLMNIDDRNIVIDMISATKNHKFGYDGILNVPDLYRQVFLDFLDADLWELKEKNLPISRTTEIEMSVFKEYGFVPFKIYKQERLKILNKLKDELSLEVDDNISFLKFFKPKIGLYCGSFDPIHKGHYNIIERSEKIFDKTIVARGVNPAKVNDIKWTADGKSDYKTEALRKSLPYHEVIFYYGFQYDLIERLKSDGYQVVLIKGLRNETDFSYEKKNNLLNDMIGVRKELEVETLFLMSDAEYEVYSSSTIKFLLSTSKAEIGYNMLHNPPYVNYNNIIDKYGLDK